MIKSERHEILFCHDLLKFLELKYPNAEFFDNFDGQSRSEFYFSNNGGICIVEAKSDIEANSTPWKCDKFQNIRDAIRREFPNKNDSKYARWIIFLAQLNDYAERFDRAKSLDAMLGLPGDRLEDARQGIKMLIEAKRSKSLSLTLDYRFECNEKLNVAYISMTKTDLSNYILALCI